MSSEGAGTVPPAGVRVVVPSHRDAGRTAHAHRAGERRGRFRGIRWDAQSGLVAVILQGSPRKPRTMTERASRCYAMNSDN